MSDGKHIIKLPYGTEVDFHQSESKQMLAFAMKLEALIMGLLSKVNANQQDFAEFKAKAEAEFLRKPQPESEEVATPTPVVEENIGGGVPE